MLNFFALTYAVGLFLVTYVNCDLAPTIIEYEPRGKFSAKRLSNSPPYGGAVYIDEKVLTSKDPNASNYRVAFKGQKCRTIWHQDLGEWVDTKIYLFKMSFKDGIKFYVWVDPKYGSQSEAQKVTKKITRSLGSIPEFLRRDIHVIVILKEGGTAGADPSSGVITWYEDFFNSVRTYVHEVYLHEAAHTSVQDLYYTKDWKDAVQADYSYISDYGQSYPEREDVAESVGAWYALKSGRLNNIDKRKITKAIPNRLALFDKLYSNENTDWYPVSGEKSGKKYKNPRKKDWGRWYHC